MATTTPNFGWDIPQSTDLVKDGATAIAALGTDIDTALVDLKGGTTGQVLSKASNTDLDFTWVAQDDSNAIQNALLTTTGDTIYASGASTPARLGIGTTGQVLTVSGGLPSWATPASGGITQISSTALSGTLVTLSSIPGTYQDLYLVVYGITNTNNNRVPRVLPNGNTTGSAYVGFNGTTGTTNTNTYIPVTAETSTLRTDANNAYIVYIYNYASTATYKFFSTVGSYISTTSARVSVFTNGTILTASAITSIGIDMQGVETMNTGTVVLYGVK